MEFHVELGGCEGSLQQGSCLGDAFDDCALGEVSKSEDELGCGGSGGAVGAHPIDSHAAGPGSLDRHSFAGTRASWATAWKPAARPVR
jgi:hypothetical protein